MDDPLGKNLIKDLNFRWQLFNGSNKILRDNNNFLLTYANKNYVKIVSQTKISNMKKIVCVFFKCISVTFYILTNRKSFIHTRARHVS